MKNLYKIFALLLIFLAAPAPLFAGEAGDKSRDRLSVGVKLLESSNYSGSLQAFEESLTSCKQRGDRAGTAKTQLMLAQYYIETLDPDNAIKNAGESSTTFDSLNDKESSFAARSILADVLFERKRIREARLLTEKLEKEMGRDFSQKTRAGFYLVRGKILRNQKKFELAGKNFEEVIRIGKSLNNNYIQILGLSEKALLLRNQKKFDEAVAVCAQGQELASTGDRIFLMALMMDTDGKIKYDDSKFNEAKVSFLGALGLYKACSNIGHEGNTMLELSQIYIRLNSIDLSKDYSGKAFDIFKASGNSFGMMQACKAFLICVYLSRSKDNVKEFQEKAGYAGKTSAYPPDPGQAYLDMGKTSEYIDTDFKTALSYYDKAYDIFSKINDDYGKVQALMARGMVLRSMDKYEDAMSAFKEGIKLRESLGSPERSDDYEFFLLCSDGAFFRQIGFIYISQYNYAKAIESFQEAVRRNSSNEQRINRVMDQNELVKAALSAHEVDLAWKTMNNSLDDIANLEEPEARPIFYNILLLNTFQASRKRNYREYEPGSRSVKTSPAGLLLQKVYDDPVLRQKIEKAYEEWIDSATKKKDQRNECLARLFRGYFFVSINKYSEAQDSYEKAIEIATKNNVTDMEYNSYFFLIDLLTIKGNLKRASEIMDEQIKVVEKMDNTLSLVYCYSHQGYLRRSQGQNEESLKNYNKALELMKKIDNSGLMAETLLRRSRTFSLMKNYKAAVRDLDEALKILQTTGDKMSIADCHTELGDNYAKMGESKKSDEYYKQAFREFQELGRMNELRDVALEYGELLENEKRNHEALELYVETLNEFLKLWNNIPPALGTVIVTQESPAKQIFDRVVNLLIKTGRHDEALKYIEMSKSADFVNSFDVTKMQIKDEKVKEMLERAQQLKRKMAAVQEELNAEENRKKKESLTQILADTKQDFFTAMNEIKTNNPDFDQLLSVRGTDLAALQKVLPENVLLIEYYPSNDILYIFVVTKESLQIKNVIVTRQRLYDLIRDFRSSFTDPNDIEYGRKLQKNRDLLYSLLLEPIEKNIDEKKEIVIIPGGLLWYLPMEILGGDGKPSLIEKKQVSYISSADILKLVSSKARISHKDAHLVAFGAPSGLNLKGTSKEVEEIGKIFSNSKIFTGDNASKKQLNREAPVSGILHIASHGSLDRNDVNKSFIQFAKDDPKLYLGEIYGIPLKDSALVTLSSCQSGLGEDNPGREFASLASAFTTAGASSVISSMWEVDDEATSQLFTEFYKNLKEGKSRAESLQLAKLKLMKNPKTSHPYFWGGFILMGDWR